MVDILAIWKISVLVAVVLVVVVVVFVAVVIVGVGAFVGAFVGSREKRSEGICPAAPTIFPPNAATDSGATC